MRKWWVGTFQQIVEFITSFGHNIRYRELCWIINGFNSKGLGNNFYQSVALNPIHKWIFFWEKILCSWVPVKVEVLFMRVHQLHFGLLQGPQPPIVVPSPGLLIYIQGLLKRKEMLQHCPYNDVSWPVTLTHQETNRKNIHQHGMYKIRVIPRVLPLGYC